MSELISFCAATHLPLGWTSTPLIDSYLIELETSCTARKGDSLSAVVLQILGGESIPYDALSPLVTYKFTDFFTPKIPLIETGNPAVGPLSLSHLAALMGDIELATTLQRLGVFDPTPLQNGATPFHLAALKGHLIFLQYAQSFDYNLETRAKSGLSAIDVCEIVHPHLAKYCPVSTLPKELSIMKGDRSVVKLPLGDAEKKLQFIFTDRICMNAATIERNLLTNDLPISNPPPKPLHPSLAITCIKECFPDLKIDPGLGLIATDLIPKGTILGKYSGLFFYETASSDHQLDGREKTFISPDGKSTSTGSIDGEFFHNLIALIADGFPNTGLTKIPSDTDSYLVTLHDILPGELILWDYGPRHRVKYGNYIHFAKKKLDDFVSALPDLLARSSTTPKDIFKIRKQIGYIFFSPQICLELALTGKLDINIFDKEILDTLHIAQDVKDIIQELSSLLQAIPSPENRITLWNFLQEIDKDDFSKALELARKCAKRPPTGDFKTYLLSLNER